MAGPRQAFTRRQLLRSQRQRAGFSLAIISRIPKSHWTHHLLRCLLRHCPDEGKLSPLLAQVTDIVQEVLRNQLIRSLSPASFARLAPYLERIELPHGYSLCKADHPFEYAYFPERGIASVITPTPTGNRVEAGVFGIDGMGPIGAITLAGTIPQNIEMQIAGSGHRISAGYLAHLSDELPEVRRLLARYVYVFSIQIAYTAMANAVCTLDKRLARWLLMSADRTDGAGISLTHDYLSIMLAVRRPGVTVALHELEGERLIKNTRGLITIRDRSALERYVGDAYGKPEAEYRRLVVPASDNRNTAPAPASVGSLEREGENDIP